MWCMAFSYLIFPQVGEMHFLSNIHDFSRSKVAWANWGCLDFFSQSLSHLEVTVYMLPFFPQYLCIFNTQCMTIHLDSGRSPWVVWIALIPALSGLHPLSPRSRNPTIYIYMYISTYSQWKLVPSLYIYIISIICIFLLKLSIFRFCFCHRVSSWIFFIASSPEHLAALCQALTAIAATWWWVPYVDAYVFSLSSLF